MESQSEGDDSYFVFLPFTNNRTNCSHLLSKLLGDGLVALCRSTILSLTSLDSSLVLAMVESLESEGAFTLGLLAWSEPKSVCSPLLLLYINVFEPFFVFV